MSHTTNSTPDPLTDLIGATMFSTVSSLISPSLPPPPSSYSLFSLSPSPSPSNFLQPAQPHPDDHALVTSRRVFSDEPHMQALLSSLDGPNRRVLEEAAERERARLPLFPACFREGAGESEVSSRKYSESCSIDTPIFGFYFG